MPARKVYTANVLPTIPSSALVLLIGVSGSGKSTFARKHFRATQIVSSDGCRAIVSDDEADQSATKDAFELLGIIVEKRLQRGRLTVVDATNVQAWARAPLLALAERYSVPAVAIVFNLPQAVCLERNRTRKSRIVDEAVITQQVQDLTASLDSLEGEGFHSVHVFSSLEKVAATPLAVNTGIRAATLDDVATMATLLDGFAQNHPAAAHPRSIEAMTDAYLGHDPISRVLLAERNGVAVALGAWRKTYDPYWSLFGGEVMALYVEPAWRGHGLALSLVAAIAAEVQAYGGRFLQGNYGGTVAPLYERMVVGRDERACHLSAQDFETLATAAGHSPREILKRWREAQN
jgi:predicted kinase/GNAT superfamily N-acetyltransferase